MYLIFCVDDQYGLQFNHRRQSRDSKVIEDIIDHIEGNVLLVNPYSSVLFKNYPKANIKVSEQPEFPNSRKSAPCIMNTALWSKTHRRN